MAFYNIAITGATGYIGKFLCDFFNKQGHSIFTLGRRPLANYSFIPFDLAEPEVYPHFNNIDVLIHAAYDFRAKDFSGSKHTNFDGSVSLFQQAKKYNMKQIIHISSISASPTALSNYGKIKYAIDEFAKEENIIRIKPGLVFNSHLDKMSYGIIGALYKLLKFTPILPRIGDGKQIFYPCHIEDLARLLNHIIIAKPATSQEFIAASATAVTFVQLLEVLAKVQNKKLITVPIPFAAFYSALYLAEHLHLNLGLRSDSLKYLLQSPENLNFSSTKDTNIEFRSFSLDTISR